MNRRGFTLIEVLIAIAILTVIVMVLYSSFSSVVNTMERSRVSAEESRLRLFLERSFRANLTSAYVDRTMEQDIFRFIGIDDETADGPNDSMRLVSINTLMGGTGLPGDLKEVRYGTVGGNETGFNPIDFRNDDEAPLDGQRKLEAIETPLFGANIQEIDSETGFVKTASDTGSSLNAQQQYQAPSWSVPIRTVDFSYFDGVDWVDEWDSQVVGRLPWCVRIRINFARTEQQLEDEKDQGLSVIDNPDFEMVVPLPVGIGRTQDARSVEDLANLEDETGTGASGTETDPSNPASSGGGQSRDPDVPTSPNVSVRGSPDSPSGILR